MRAALIWSAAAQLPLSSRERSSRAPSGSFAADPNSSPKAGAPLPHSKAARALLILLTLLSLSLPAATNYVWPDSPSPAFPYESWETAARSLHVALTAAAPFNTILVTNGTYTGNMGGPYGDTVILVTNRHYVKSVNLHGAIIDGQNTRRCAAIARASTLDGFQLVNGAATAQSGIQYPNIAGGVVLFPGGNLLNCIVSNNTAPTKYIVFGRLPGYAGGVAVNGDGLVSNCIIVRNVAFGIAGGVVCSNGGTIIDSVIANNIATNNGAGAFLWYGGLITNCLIAYNTVTNLAGGVMCERGGTVVGCTITGNRVVSFDKEGGGAVTYHGGTIRSCVISNNYAFAAGGVYLMYNGIVEDCLITNNVAADNGGGVRFYYGGLCRRCRIIGNTAGTWGGGGVFFSRTGVLQNCLVALNVSSNRAGGVLFFSKNLSQLGYAESCTITANQAPMVGGVYFEEADGTGVGGCITNCIIYGNTSFDVGNIHMARAGYCCSSTNLSGDGNLNADPLFENPSENDFRLQLGSPCINAGTNLPWMAGATDLAGHPRIHHGRVDIGCYEYIPEPTGLTVFLVGWSVIMYCYHRSRLRGSAACC